MADDEYFGSKSYLPCVPRRLLVMLMATFWLLDGLVEVLRLTLLQLGGNLTPSHCVGHRCREVATCAGEVEGSFHVRMLLATLGGLVFGYMGLNGASHGVAWELRCFAVFLIVTVAFDLGCVLWDFGYMRVCDAYPWNVLSWGALWPLPNLPIEDDAKEQIRKLSGGASLSTYPIPAVGLITHNANIWSIYLIRTLLGAAICLWGAREAFELAHHVSVGVLGLGVNYNIKTWRESLFLRRGIERFFAEVHDEIEDGRNEIRALASGKMEQLPRSSQSRGGLPRAVPAPQYT